MKAEFDGGAVEGRIAISQPRPDGGARVEADLKSERLDLDAAIALLRSLGGPQGEWPEEAQLSLDVGRAVAAGRSCGRCRRNSATARSRSRWSS